MKLGIVGLSPGNGHPYSWSAIFNGYDKELMGKCGFPVIPDYLSKESFPAAQIKSAKVTHIWTQSLELSKKVADTCYILNVCESIEELIEEVDAVLLARDDYESHNSLGPKILESGKPVYIDKPIAVYEKDLNFLYGLQKFEGQIFTCSAMRFANELRLGEQEVEELGQIEFTFASIPKDWEKYAIHIIEPVYDIVNSTPKKVSSVKTKNGRLVTVQWENGVVSNFIVTGTVPSSLSIEIWAQNKGKKLRLVDTFGAFKSSLEVFVSKVKTGKYENEIKRQRDIVKIIEEGGEIE